VPVEHLERLFRVAWFCHPWTLPQIQVQLPKDSSFSAESGERIDNVVIRRSGDIIDIQVESTGGQPGSIRQVAAIASRLKVLPDGAVLNFDTAWLSPEHLKKKKPIALHRYRGVVTRRSLVIQEAFPCADAGKLNAAFALAAQVETESVIDAGDVQTAAAVLAYLKTHAFFSDNPAVASGPTGIAMKTPEPVMLNFVAGDVFKRHFRDDFPLLDLEQDDEDEEDDDTNHGTDAAKTPLPPKREVLLNGANGRVLYASDAMQMSEAVKTRIAAVEKELERLGFQFVADIVCKPLDQVIIRAYAQNGGTVWAALQLGIHGNGVIEFITKFDKGATLTVTTNMTARDELFRHAFKSSRPSAALSVLWKESQRRSAWLSKIHGAPLKLTTTARGLAEDVEESIRRQEAKDPAKICERILTGDDERSYYTFDGKTLDATASEVIAGADRAMKDLGYEPIGDVVSSFLSSTVQRGYAKKGRDTWAKFAFEACSSEGCNGSWEFVTSYENGVLVTTRAAMSKDEPKRKIYRVLDPKSPPREMLAKHEKRRADLVPKCGAPIPVKADLHGLAAECEASMRRLIG
jgi:hypothetical protein